MKELVQRLMETFQKREDAVLVTIISSVGSTPRSEGAHMLISKEGRLCGTVGGGAVEFRSEELGRLVLEEKKGRLQEYNLAPNAAADLGMICGGKVTVLFQYLSWQRSEIVELFQGLQGALEAQNQCWLCSPLASERTDELAFYSQETGWLGAPARIDEGLLEPGVHTLHQEEAAYFIEELVHMGKVYVFGGGHVAQALIPVLKQLDFYCVVADDRSDFLTEALFPTADERLLVDLSEIRPAIELTDRDYVIVMTRGHLFDFEVTRQVLASPARYIGVMGSKHKVAVQVQKLHDIGFSMERISTIRMPIGLKIGAETPAELAISVAGELIEVRAADGPKHLLKTKYVNVWRKNSETVDGSK